MKKIFLALILVLGASAGVMAQQYPLLTNYMTNLMAFNPAVAGTDTIAELKALHRTQWLGIDGAPQTTYLTGHAKLGSSPFGIGGYLTRDVAGSLSKTGVNGVFSVHQRIGESGLLSIGATVGFYNIKLLETYQAAYADRDLTLQNGLLGAWAPDLGMGAYFKQGKFWAGLSIPQLFQSTIVYDPSLSNAVPAVG